MKQHYHTIIRPDRNGWFVGWVEEIPGTLTCAQSLEDCRRNLREALELMLQTRRDATRQCLDPSCLQESIEIDVLESDSYSGSHPPA